MIVMRQPCKKKIRNILDKTIVVHTDYINDMFLQ